MTNTNGKTRFITRSHRPDIAFRQTEGRGPTIVFLSGYASDMAGSKACALFDWAVDQGRSCILFDYSGCGASGGQFADETLDNWRDDVLDVINARTAADAPLLLVGSSMGGWLMMLVALAIPRRIAGLVGIAAAPDFTDWGYSDAEKATLQQAGRLYQDNPYGPEPTLTTLALWQSGERNLLLDAEIPITCPVELIHGQADSDVPFAISLRAAERLRSAEVRVQLVKAGDHRLSRAADIERLVATVAALLANIESSP